ncbi:hypothetical protein GF361_05405 [Candidatus Woesearchaeota archaeon]|nr:hypothetical protein [Candidatus Woesearchaeota archaeon]
MKKRGKYFIAPASTSRRIISFIIDMIIINFIIFNPFKGIFQKLIPAEQSYEAAKEYIAHNPHIMNTITFLFLIIGIIIVFYFTVFGYLIQQTPGKIVTGLYIIPENKKISFLNYLLSNISFIPVFPFFLLWIIDPIYMFTSPKSQRLMERLNKILVVQKYKLK